MKTTCAHSITSVYRPRAGTWHTHIILPLNTRQLFECLAHRCYKSPRNDISLLASQIENNLSSNYCDEIRPR